MIKKSILIVSLLTLSLGTFALAKESNQNQYIDTNKGKVYHDEKTGARIVKVWEVTEKGLKEVPIEDYLNHKSVNYKSLGNKKSDQDVSIQNYLMIYDETSYSLNVRLYGDQVSAFLENPTSNPASKSISSTASESYSTSISLTSPELYSVKAGIGYSWTSSASITETNTMTVSPYHRGWFGRVR